MTGAERLIVESCRYAARERRRMESKARHAYSTGAMARAANELADCHMAAARIYEAKLSEYLARESAGEQ